ncbi:hypothetical protein DFJ73DRAFT_825845 [Zopfochytrium polystomum]|nr:hypothetical protein DFJ73DRAFT_825845 [Zopfochytrium polystomum]
MKRSLSSARENDSDPVVKRRRSARLARASPADPPPQQPSGVTDASIPEVDAMADALPATDTALPDKMTLEELELYDRQIRLWGLDAQTRMRQARVLVVGINGLANELCKNIVLAGIGSLTLMDPNTVSISDLGAQFLLSLSDVGKNRAKSVVPRLSVLNPRVKISALEDDSQLGHQEFIAGFDVVILSGQRNKTEIISLNRSCRAAGAKFFLSSSFGSFGYIFSDLSNYSFSPKQCNSSLLKDAIKKSWSETKPRAIKRVPTLLFALQCAWNFDVDPSDSSALSTKCVAYCESVGLENEVLSSDFLRTVLSQLGAEITPVSAIVGGILAQEVLGAVSSKAVSVNNFFCFSALAGDGKVVHLQ